jgi:hypothetical protein
MSLSYHSFACRSECFRSSIRLMLVQLGLAANLRNASRTKNRIFWDVGGSLPTNSFCENPSKSRSLNKRVLHQQDNSRLDLDRNQKPGNAREHRRSKNLIIKRPTDRKRKFTTTTPSAQYSALDIHSSRHAVIHDGCKQCTTASCANFSGGYFEGCCERIQLKKPLRFQFST